MVEERNMFLYTFIAQVLRRTWEATWGLAGKAGSASTASGMSQEGEHLLGSTLCLIQGSHSTWLRPGQSCSSVLQSCKPHRKLFYVLETTRSELKKTVFVCAVLMGLTQQMEGKNFSAVGAMNGRWLVTLRVRRSFPDLQYWLFLSTLSLCPWTILLCLGFFYPSSFRH